MSRTRFAQIGALGLVSFVAVTVHARQTIYVNGATGNNAGSGLCGVWNGGMCGSKLSIGSLFTVGQQGLYARTCESSLKRRTSRENV